MTIKVGDEVTVSDKGIAGVEDLTRGHKARIESFAYDSETEGKVWTVVMLDGPAEGVDYWAAEFEFVA